MCQSIILISTLYFALASLVDPAECRRFSLVKRDAAEAVAARQLVDPLLLTPPPVPATATSNNAPLVYAYFTPSPAASPVPITQISQVVTSFVPQLTVCALPPLAFYSGRFSNASTTGGPYRNYSASTPPGPGTCQTAYTPTLTTVCATILTGLATHVTVSNCSQQVTFSSRFDYELESRLTTDTAGVVSAAPTVRPVTTFYIAPWQKLGGAQPPADVDVKICTTYANGTSECLLIQQVWTVEPVTITTSTTSHVDLTTEVRGPARVMFETIEIDVTKRVELVTMSTQLALAYELETMSTRRVNRTSSVFSIVSSTTSVVTSSVVTEAWSPTPTVSRTRTLAFAHHPNVVAVPAVTSTVPFPTTAPMSQGPLSFLRA